MRILILSLILIIEIILESTILPFIEIKSVAPNLMLITIISMGLIYGKREGIFLGLIGGLLYDILFGRILGVYGLIYMLIGYFMGISSEKVYRENRLIPLLFTIMGTLVYHGSFYLFQYLLGYEFSIIQYLKEYTGISLLLNVILVMFVYPIFLKLRNWNLLRDR